MKPPLALYKHFIPFALAAPRDSDVDGPHASLPERDGLQTATVFDCRSVDPLFLRDTGQAARHEAEQVKQKFRLPFDNCYFEFSDQFGVHATEIGQYPPRMLTDEIIADGSLFDDEPLDYTVDVIPYEVSQGNTAYSPNGWGEFKNFNRLAYDPSAEDELEPAILYSPLNSSDDEEAIIERAGDMLAGVLTLLREKLLATEVVPDECSKLNKARAKRGKLPLSGERRVLTINTAAVRRITRSVALHKHESPRLHWRRGHWRVIHRGSEFETSAWVRRCLVGDPEKGAVHKDYRVTWELPMLAAAQ